MAEVCETLLNDPKLANGFNAIGLSQGGLLMRAAIHRCPDLKVKKFITMGSPLMGTSVYPGCGDNSGWIQSRVVRAIFGDNSRGMIPCSVINTLVGSAVYSSVAQCTVMPAQYLKDPKQLSTYKSSCKFLTDINNEGGVFHPEYKTNFCKIEKLIIFSFLEEEIVHPIESTVRSFPLPIVP